MKKIIFIMMMCVCGGGLMSCGFNPNDDVATNDIYEVTTVSDVDSESDEVNEVESSSDLTDASTSSVDSSDSDVRTVKNGSDRKTAFIDEDGSYYIDNMDCDCKNVNINFNECEGYKFYLWCNDSSELPSYNIFSKEEYSELKESMYDISIAFKNKDRYGNSIKRWRIVNNNMSKFMAKSVEYSSDTIYITIVKK